MMINWLRKLAGEWVRGRYYILSQTFPSDDNDNDNENDDGDAMEMDGDGCFIYSFVSANIDKANKERIHHQQKIVRIFFSRKEI